MMLLHTLRGQYDAMICELDIAFCKKHDFRETWTKTERGLHLFQGENKMERFSTKVAFSGPHYGRILILDVQREGFWYSTCWLMCVWWLCFHV